MNDQQPLPQTPRRLERIVHRSASPRKTLSLNQTIDLFNRLQDAVSDAVRLIFTLKPNRMIILCPRNAANIWITSGVRASTIFRDVVLGEYKGKKLNAKMEADLGIAHLDDFDHYSVELID